MILQRILTGGLATLLLVAPLPFGSVQARPASILVAACLILGAIWVWWRSRRGLPPFPWKDPVVVAGLLLALVGLVQMIPLPRTVLSIVSPKTVELRDTYEPSTPAGDSGARPISLYPWATARSTLRLVGFLIVTLMLIDLAGIPSSRRTILGALIAGGGFQAFYGLAEYFSGHQHIFAYTKKFYTDVATGTFINRNHFAGYLEMTLPLVIAAAAEGLPHLPSRPGGLGQRLAGMSDRDLFRFVVLLVIGVTMGTALVCSRSRMGIASTCLALLAIGLISAYRGRGRGFVVAAFIVMSATLLLFGQAGAGHAILSRFLGAATDLNGGVSRWRIWSQAAHMVAAFPAFGVGMGAFAQVFPAYRSSWGGIYLDHAHNDYLEFAAESGLVGFTILVLGIMFVARPMLRSPGRPDFGLVGQAGLASIIAIALHSMTDFNLAIPANALTFSVLLGIVICWTRVPQPALAREPSGPQLRSWKTLIIGGLLLGGGLSSATSTTAALMSPFLTRAIPTLCLGDAEHGSKVAGDTARIAIKDLEELARAKAVGEAPSDEAIAYVEGELTEAIAMQRTALRYQPTSSSGHLALGYMIAGQCGTGALSSKNPSDCIPVAMHEFRDALALNPVGASMHAQVAHFLLSVWAVLSDVEKQEAQPMILRAIELNRFDAALRKAWEANKE
jgi:O-antigen ligase